VIFYSFVFFFSACFIFEIRNSHIVLQDLYDIGNYEQDYLIQSNQPTGDDDSNGAIVKSHEINTNIREDYIDFIVEKKHRSLRLSEPDCFCPNGRKNWIYYNDCPGRGKKKNSGAGIKDRQDILRNIMWYADELCAKVALLCDPNDWLAKKHGCYAPKTSDWSSYFTTVRKSSNGTYLSTVDILYTNVNENNESKLFHGLSRIKGTSKEMYNLGRSLHAKDEPFVWEFDRSYWRSELGRRRSVGGKKSELGRWPNQKLDHRAYNKTCGLIDFDTSDELLSIAHFAMKELGFAYSQDFVTLHLRRGDNRVCDTDVDTVMKYLKCSIASDDVKHVVVLTNEKEENYLKELTQNFANQFPSMEMILLDRFLSSKPFLEKLTQNNIMKRSGDEFLNDNCFLFSAEKVLASMARYHLERGRVHCKKCDRGGSRQGKWKMLI
jgi:hypothetical protein